MNTKNQSMSSRKFSSRLFVALIAVTIGMLTTKAQAIDFQWVGTDGAFFSAPSSWNPSGSPGPSDNAIFPFGLTRTVNFVTSRATNGLSIQAGDTTFRPVNSLEYTIAATSTIDSGSLTLTGNGTNTFLLNSTAINTGMNVGNSGSGILNILDGGSAQFVGDVNIARLSGSSGAVTVDGVNASLALPNRFLRVGDDGNGTLLIQNGGSVLNSLGRIGNDDGSIGQATVTGPGSTWTNSNSLLVGAFGGDGTLLIQNGGNVLSSSGTIGFNSASTGEVTIDGTDSSWSMPQSLSVGDRGTGTLLIQNGGTVSNSRGTIGEEAGSNGQVTVSGAGSTWTNSTDLFVGGDTISSGGTGAVNIGPGGTVSAGGFTRLYTDGQVNLQGGTFVTDSFDVQGGIFNWESGTLNLTSAAGLTIGQNQFFGSSLALNANQNLDITNTLTIDPGTTLFTDGDLSTGSLMNNGDLILANSFVDGEVTSPAGSTITVLGDVFFSDPVSGAGGFFGPGTAIFDGGYSPGDSPAVVPIEGSLVFGSANTLTIELGGLLAGEFDQLDIEGDATLGGLLDLQLLGGFGLGLNQQFTILDIAGTSSGQFFGLGEGALVGNFGGQDLFISYAVGDGNNVALFTAVPEPSSLVLLMLSLLGLCRTRNVVRNKQ